MKTFLDITNELMKERNLAYSPKTFNNIYNEVKSTPKYIESNQKRNEWLLSIAPKQKEQTFSFMSNHLTTDNRLK
jgi:glycine cleavage system H lipoate-binding protein